MGSLSYYSAGTFGHGGAFGTEGWIDPARRLITVLLLQRSSGGDADERNALQALAASAVVDCRGLRPSRRPLLESPGKGMANTPSLPDGPALIVVGGPTDGEVFPLEKDRSLIVGSGRLANLRLGPSDISSAHIKVTWDDAGLFVNDNTSFTGTYLNGEVIEQAPLQDGDLIAFADPKDKPDWPKLRIHVPPGSIIITAPPPEPEPPPLAVEPPMAAPVPRRPRRLRPGRGPVRVRPRAAPRRAAAPGPRSSPFPAWARSSPRWPRPSVAAPSAWCCWWGSSSTSSSDRSPPSKPCSRRWESRDRPSPSGVIASPRMRPRTSCASVRPWPRSPRRARPD